jgi:hypothetical protein
LSARRCIVRSESGTVYRAIQFVSTWIGYLDSMGLLPQSGSDAQRFDPIAVPPGTFVASPMKFAMMEPANRDGMSVADLSTHRTLLRKPDVVGIRRGSAANQTRLRGHKSQMVAIALAHRFADGNDTLGVDLSRR